MNKKAVLVCLMLLAILPSTAFSQDRISLAFGWPVVMSDTTWDDLGATIRLGYGHGWKLTEQISIGADLVVVTPTNTPHPSLQAVLSGGYRLIPKLSLGGGVSYQINPPYQGQWSNFLGFGFGPTISLPAGMSFSLITGPGITLEKDLWTWIFQPKFSFSF